MVSNVVCRMNEKNKIFKFTSKIILIFRGVDLLKRVNHEIGVIIPWKSNEIETKCIFGYLFDYMCSSVNTGRVYDIYANIVVTL